MKKLFFVALFQLLFAASLFGQKYDNGTKLLKGAEVMSGTPLQLDYVLEKLADTAQITVNIHEGKTHLVLDDGSGAWREWWYHQDRWKPKGSGALPAGRDGAIQTRSGNRFEGSDLFVDKGIFKPLLPLTVGDVGMKNGDATLSVNPQGAVEHRREDGYWNFRSSFSDSSFNVRKRIVFEPEDETFDMNIHTVDYGYVNLVTKLKSNKYINAMEQNDETTRFLMSTGGWRRDFTLTQSAMEFGIYDVSTPVTRFRVDDAFLYYETPATVFQVNNAFLKYRLKSDATGDYFSYIINDRVLRVRNTIQFMPADHQSPPAISVTANKDLRFSRAVTSENITLTELIQKGQIIMQETEPAIPDESFAFWVNGGTFHLILRSGGVQKKILFN